MVKTKILNYSFGFAKIRVFLNLTKGFLGYWVIRLLGYWVIGLLGYWVIELLDY